MSRGRSIKEVKQELEKLKPADKSYWGRDTPQIPKKPIEQEEADGPEST
jgi:hypothetical protein